MDGFRLGSISGFEIRIDLSWFVIFLLVLWSLAMGLFPARVPGLSAPVYLAMGLVATILFFGSVVLHELSHALVARRKGIPVEGITLFIFGGLAHTRMEFERPGDELAIAGIGPVTSVLIGLAFGALAVVGVRAGWPPAVTAVPGYLAAINILLAAFNLLPGFPLDGGRLFRAAVWKATGDMTKATRWATTGGKLLGLALIVFGFFQMLSGVFGGGLWLVFIGWFVRMAAQASLTQFLVRQSLVGLRAADVMTTSPETVPADLSIGEFVEEHVLGGRHHAYPVTEDGHPVGLVTLRQVKELPRAEWPRRPVRDVMTPVAPDLAIRPDEPVADALDRLGRSPSGRLLVMRDGTLEGLIARSDIARWVERRELLGPR